MRVIILKSCVYCAIYKLLLSHELWFNFCMRVTSYCLLHELWVTFIAQVTSYFLHKNYEFLFVARFTSYFVLGVMIKMSKGFSMKKIYIFYFFYFFYLFICLLIFLMFFWKTKNAKTRNFINQKQGQKFFRHENFKYEIPSFFKSPPVPFALSFYWFLNRSP